MLDLSKKLKFRNRPREEIVEAYPTKRAPDTIIVECRHAGTDMFYTATYRADGFFYYSDCPSDYDIVEAEE